MPSVSELQRLEEERANLIQKICNSEAGSRVKEGWLRELRSIERQLGIKGLPYNDSMWPNGYRAEDER